MSQSNKATFKAHADGLIDNQDRPGSFVDMIVRFRHTEHGLSEAYRYSDIIQEWGGYEASVTTRPVVRDGVPPHVELDITGLPLRLAEILRDSFIETPDGAPIKNNPYMGSSEAIYSLPPEPYRYQFPLIEKAIQTIRRFRLE